MNRPRKKIPNSFKILAPSLIPWQSQYCNTMSKLLDLDAALHEAYPSFYHMSNRKINMLSSIGMGTTRGDKRKETDIFYVNGLKMLVNGGTNGINISSKYHN